MKKIIAVLMLLLLVGCSAAKQAPAITEEQFVAAIKMSFFGEDISRKQALDIGDAACRAVKNAGAVKVVDTLKDSGISLVNSKLIVSSSVLYLCPDQHKELDAMYKTYP